MTDRTVPTQRVPTPKGGRLPYIDRDGAAIHYDAAGDGDVVLFTLGFGAFLDELGDQP